MAVYSAPFIVVCLNCHRLVRGKEEKEKLPPVAKEVKMEEGLKAETLFGNEFKEDNSASVPQAALKRNKERLDAYYARYWRNTHSIDISFSDGKTAELGEVIDSLIRGVTEAQARLDEKDKEIAILKKHIARLYFRDEGGNQEEIEANIL